MFGSTVHKYSMISFKYRERRRRHLAPEADRILPLVAAAGTLGMNRKQIGSAVDLDRDVLAELLAGLVNIGLLTVAWEYGVPIYRVGVLGGY